MTKEDTPKPTIEFAPGCFDDFDGTQEELDEFIAEITKSVEDGTLLENSVSVNLDDDEAIEQMINDMSPEQAKRLLALYDEEFDASDEEKPNRKNKMN